MLKITEVPAGNRKILLKLEGKLLEPWLGELNAALVRASSPAKSVRLDLSGVNFADSAGVTLLRTWLGIGVAIDSCSGFVAELLRQEKRS